MLTRTLLTPTALGLLLGRKRSGSPLTWQTCLCTRVAAWVRRYFRVHPHTKTADLDRNYKPFLNGMKDGEKRINEHYEILQLLGSMLARLQMLIDAKGDRLKY